MNRLRILSSQPLNYLSVELTSPLILTSLSGLVKFVA